MKVYEPHHEVIARRGRMLRERYLANQAAEQPPTICPGCLRPFPPREYDLHEAGCIVTGETNSGQDVFI